MGVFVANRDRVRDALTTVAERVAALVRDLPDTSAGMPRSSCGPSFCVTFDDGEATVTAEPLRRVDCRLIADPAVLFLVPMGIMSQWTGIAKGKLFTWGRKPWLALRFVGFFEVP